MKFDSDGLMPVIVQDDLTGEVRMLALRERGSDRRDEEDEARDFFFALAQRAVGEGRDERALRGRA